MARRRNRLDRADRTTQKRLIPQRGSFSPGEVLMRKVLLHPFTLGFAFVAVGSAAFGQIALSVLAVIATLAIVAFLSISESKSLRDEGAMTDLSNEERAQLAPLR